MYPKPISNSLTSEVQFIPNVKYITVGKHLLNEKIPQEKKYFSAIHWSFRIPRVTVLYVTFDTFCTVLKFLRITKWKTVKSECYSLYILLSVYNIQSQHDINATH